MDMAKVGTIKVLDKAGAIFDILRSKESVTVIELLERLDESRTTIVRICETLVALRLLERERTGRVGYRLGMGCVELGQLAAGRVSLRQDATPELERLATATGDTVNLVSRQADAAVCLLRVEGSFPVVSRALREGGQLPYDRGGASQAILAFSSTSFQDQVLNRLPASQRTLLRSKLPEIRRAGYYFSRGEFLAETAAIGAPVFDASEEAVAGVSISGIASRFADNRVDSLVSELLQSGEAISRLLGYTGEYTSTTGRG